MCEPGFEPGILTQIFKDKQVYIVRYAYVSRVLKEGGSGSQEKARDPLEEEAQVAMSRRMWLLRPEFRSSENIASLLKYSIIKIIKK